MRLLRAAALLLPPLLSDPRGLSLPARARPVCLQSRDAALQAGPEEADPEDPHWLPPLRSHLLPHPEEGVRRLRLPGGPQPSLQLGQEDDPAEEPRHRPHALREGPAAPRQERLPGEGARPKKHHRAPACANRGPRGAPHTRRPSARPSAWRPRRSFPAVQPRTWMLPPPPLPPPILRSCTPFLTTPLLSRALLHTRPRRRARRRLRLPPRRVPLCCRRCRLSSLLLHVSRAGAEASAARATILLLRNLSTQRRRSRVVYPTRAAPPVAAPASRRGAECRRCVRVPYSIRRVPFHISL